MPVKVYVRRDSQGRELPAKYSHESWGTLGLIHRLWTAYDGQSTAFAIAVSLEKPSADLVIVSERGVGVIELKDIPGEVRESSDGSWHAYYRRSHKRISGGKRNGEPRENPHEQVRDYALDIRKNSENLLKSWTSRDIEDLRFNTAVCFTHPAANIEAFRQAYESSYRGGSDWERFHILTPKEIVKWVHTVSFEDEEHVGYYRGYTHFERSLLTKRQVNALPVQLFGMVESQEIPKTMLSNEPYAYLSLIENGYRAQIFSLYPGSTTIGRDPESIVPIPMRYGGVSRHHARILHSVNGTFIQDNKSKHGTYVSNQQVKQPVALPIDQTTMISLCQPGPGQNACLLEFRYSPLRESPPSTLGWID